MLTISGTQARRAQVPLSTLCCLSVQERLDLLSRHSSLTHRLFMSISAQLLKTLVCMPKFFILGAAHWMKRCWLPLEAWGLFCFYQEHWLLSQLGLQPSSFCLVIVCSCVVHLWEAWNQASCSFHTYSSPETQPVILPHLKAYSAQYKEIPQTG